MAEQRTVQDQTAKQPTRQPLLGQSPESIKSMISAKLDTDWPAYRYGQVIDWLHKPSVTAFEQMSNLSADMRKQLSDHFVIHQADVVAHQKSSDGTQKLLLSWSAGGTSECVLIPTAERRTACISTQVGCPVKCAFCASGIDGLQRNLSVAEITEQARRVAGLCTKEKPLTNVVFMGLGEPLANYSATVDALRWINAEWGLGIGARRITISTVGLPTQMRRLADEAIQCTLALSLHAPNDELRRELIPWAERVSIDELIDACRYYFDRTGREVTLEYILLGGVNHLDEHADALARLTRKMRSNVNLIAYNAVNELGFVRPTNDSVERFRSLLAAKGVNVHVRTSRGRDIDAACGQLRRKQSPSRPTQINLA